MTRDDPVVVDTNVVVSGLITRDPEAPTARVLDGMLRREFNFVLSVALLAEYRAVLRRPRIAARHGLTDAEIDRLLTEIAMGAIFRDPRPTEAVPPDPGDRHVWDLLAAQDRCILVTGDRALLDHPPSSIQAISAAELAVRLAGPGR